jgi:site-specific recombinase XerD
VYGNGQQNLINKWLKDFAAKHGFAHINPHALRHTNITLMISGGVDVRTVASKAGHSRTSTTLDIYSHALQAYDEKATAVIDEILTPKENRA